MVIAIEERNPFENYFSKVIIIMKVTGLWIPVKASARQKTLYSLGTVTILILLIVYQLAETAVMLVKPDLARFLRSLRDQFNHFLCFFKLITWFSHRKLIMSMMETLQDPKYLYDKYNCFDDKEIVQFNKTQADRWVILFLSFVNLICINMTAITLLVFLFFGDSQYYENEEGRLAYVQQLPVNLVTPFERESRFSFIMHFIYEMFALVIHAWMIVGLDGLFTTLMSCVSAHLGILAQAFHTIRSRCSKRLNLEIKERLHDPPELKMEMLREIKKCIQHLNMLFDISSKLERTYHIQTILQVMTSLFEMCLCLYFLSNTLNAEMGSELTFLVSTSFQLLLYCWFGNACTEASIALTDNIYEGDWLSAERSFKSCILITMTRLRKPIYVTIGKFTPLTFTTFLAIARVAYSFFTVLKSNAFD